jgi:hypothetical protein
MGPQMASGATRNRTGAGWHFGGRGKEGQPDKSADSERG